MGRSAWHALQSVDTFKLREMPRPPTGNQTAARVADPYRDQRSAVVTAAYHAATDPLLVGWHRPTRNGPIDVYVGGPDLTDPDSPFNAPAMLNLPPGGRGYRVPAGSVAEAFGELPFWCALTVITDGLAGEEDPPPDSQLRPSLEDCLLVTWQAPFGWLVLAEPVTGADLDELIADVGDQHRDARRKAETSPDYAVMAQRLERRHRELAMASSTGLWRTHILAGGVTSTAARQVAALLCSSTDLDGLPYAFAPGTSTGILPDVLGADLPTAPLAAPIDASTALVTRIARPPASEVPGVRFRLVPEFDVSPETASVAPNPAAGSSVRLGEVIDRNQHPAGPLDLTRTSLNRHTFVCGATGAGKSQTIRALLEASTSQGLPWLVVEPAKAEYRLMAARLAGTDASVVVLRPGAVDLPPAGLNPLEPGVDTDGRRFPLQTHIDLLRSLFLAAFNAEEPFPQVLATALTRCYEQLGWDLVLGEPAVPGTRPRYPTLADVQRAAMAVVEEIGYGKEITDNVRGFISVRLASLRLGTPGRFFEGGHPIDVDALLSRNVVIEIEDVGDDRDKAFLLGTVLIRLVEQLRLRHARRGAPSSPLGHLTVVEEAHRLLRNTEQPGPAAHAVEMFAGLLAEVRAYGEGLVIAEQIPSKLLPDVIKNTAVKVVHRLPAEDDRDAVGATMNMTEAQSEYLVTLRPGQAAVFTDGMDYPVLAAMPDGTARESDNVAIPDTPIDLIGRRSETCGAECLAAPCSLRQIRAAQHALELDARLVLWAELAVLAHLTGWTTPVPHGFFHATLREFDARTLECAIGHAVDAAVASRSTAFTRRVSPAALATHVAGALRTFVTTGQRHIGEEPQWLAPAYRWCYIWDALKTVDGKDPDAGRHPRTEEWEQRYGCVIPGDTNRAQLEVVTGWFDHDQRDGHALRTIAYGSHPTPAVVTAVGTTPHNPDWTERLTQHLDQFVQCRWPLRYLTQKGG